MTKRGAYYVSASALKWASICGSVLAGAVLLAASDGAMPSRASAQAAPTPSPTPACVQPAPTPAPSPTPAFSSTVPTDIANPADPQQAATFAWQEFIALTWPAMTNPTPAPGISPYCRGLAAASATSGSASASAVTVWETFYHRDELYPTYATASGNTLPDPNAIPNYLYDPAVAPATPTTDQTLFNNTDEASEISLAHMYYTPGAQKVDALKQQYPQPTPAQQGLIKAAAIQAGLVYEAKGNPVIYNYLQQTGFNNAAPRRNARTQAVNLIMNHRVRGAVFSLPAGSIEIKATWRHYDPSVDNLNDYHWANGIYYTTNAAGVTVANNGVLLLISLHIIQKTPNVPTFTFATFEHVTDEASGFRFTNTNPQTSTMGLPRALPDPGVIAAARQFPIPGSASAFDLNAFNVTMQAAVRAQFGAGNVWANYRLIGVQAGVQDDPGGSIPAQQFFLSNFATETNDTLQFFQGALGGTDGNVPSPNLPRVYTLDATTSKYVGHTSGGCLGCHGAAGQFLGGDFSVIAATGNAFAPEAVTPYPGGSTVVPQNPAGFPLPQQTPTSAAKMKPSSKKGK